VAVADEDVAVASDDHVGRRAELVRTVPRHFARAELKQDLAGGAQLRHLLADGATRAAAIGRQRIGHPHVAFLVHVDPRDRCVRHAGQQCVAALVGMRGGDAERGGGRDGGR
jgi:hypothetical protein